MNVHEGTAKSLHIDGRALAAELPSDDSPGSVASAESACLVALVRTFSDGNGARCEVRCGIASTPAADER